MWYPQRREQAALSRIQARARLRQRFGAQGVDRLHTIGCAHGAHLKYRCRWTIPTRAEPQRGVVIQQVLQHVHHIGELTACSVGGCLQHHCLVELIHLAVHGLQPAHHRRRRDGRGNVLTGLALTTHEGGRCSQPCNRLLDEHIARPEPQTLHTGLRDDPHRQNAVAAECEERIVDAHPVHTEYFGINVCEDPLDV